MIKMCYIVYRINSSVPCILMGESGVGKTSLIKFLANNVFNEEFKVFNVNAGVN